jgi:hypothetical protein
VLQGLALQDLAAMAQEPSEHWRRAAIFGDESGAAWKAPVQACLDEVGTPHDAWSSGPCAIQRLMRVAAVQLREVTQHAAAALAQAAPQPAAKGGRKDANAAPKWNARPASTKLAVRCKIASSLQGFCRG